MFVHKKRLYYILAIVAILVTLTVGISHGHYSLTAFAVLPYLTILYLLRISIHRTSINVAKIVTVFIVCVGLYFLLDTTYMERNLEHKFSFFFIPIWQETMLLVTGFVIYLSNEKDALVSE